MDSNDYQWGNQNVLLIIAENNIIHCKIDQKALKDYDREAAEMRKPRNPSVESKINGPFVHNLPKKKPVKRKVFTSKVCRARMVSHIVFRRAKCIIISFWTLQLILGLYSFFLPFTVDV